jgi:hypothetical protein
MAVQGERGGSPARALATSANAGVVCLGKGGIAAIAERFCESDDATVVWGARPAWFATARGTRPENPPPRAAPTSARCGLSIGHVRDRAFSDVSGMSGIARRSPRHITGRVLRDTGTDASGELPISRRSARKGSAYGTSACGPTTVIGDCIRDRSRRIYGHATTGRGACLRLAYCHDAGVAWPLARKDVLGPADGR